MFNRLFIGAIALIISIYLSAPVFAVDSLDIDHDKREELLPYSLESQLVLSWKERQLIYRPAQIAAKDSATNSSYLIYIRNPDGSEDNYTQIGTYSAIDGNTVNDQPMRLIVTDFVTFVDSVDSSVRVAGIGLQDGLSICIRTADRPRLHRCCFLRPELMPLETANGRSVAGLRVVLTMTGTGSRRC